MNLPPNEGAALATLEDIAACLADAFDSGDAATIRAALARVAHAPGLAQLAGAAGLPRAQLAEVLIAGELQLDTLLSIMKVIDLHRPADGALPN